MFYTAAGKLNHMDKPLLFTSEQTSIKTENGHLQSALMHLEPVVGEFIQDMVIHKNLNQETKTHQKLHS